MIDHVIIVSVIIRIRYCGLSKVDLSSVGFNYIANNVKSIGTDTNVIITGRNVVVAVVDRA